MLQVVLEGLWQEGFMAIAAIGATNIGSIEVTMLLLRADKLLAINSELYYMKT